MFEVFLFLVLTTFAVFLALLCFIHASDYEFGSIVMEALFNTLGVVCMIGAMVLFLLTLRAILIFTGEIA